jgi:SAM-dependent methyltransferase
MSFRDHFSGHAASYREARPVYPASLAKLVASLAPARRRVWDAGTGNGQLAQLLADEFEHVYATDASSEQIAQSTPHPRITFKTEPAETPEVEPASFDAVTVAQAAHWLDLPRFYEAVRRAARPGAPIVLVAYDLCTIAPLVDEILRAFSEGTVGADWPPERRLVDARYRTLPFPFERVELPPTSMHRDWRLDDLLAYVGSWSSVRRCQRRTGADPLLHLRSQLQEVWESSHRYPVTWDLVLLAGRVS